jgi:hypothetical protein
LKKLFWVEEEKRERRIDAVEMMGTAAFHQPLASAGCDLAGGVVALGKFDALHVGHRALAERAAEIGIPFLLSFSGMAQVLGWEPRYDLFLSSLSVSICDFFLSLPPFFAQSF